MFLTMLNMVKSVFVGIAKQVLCQDIHRSQRVGSHGAAQPRRDPDR